MLETAFFSCSRDPCGRCQVEKNNIAKRDDIDGPIG